MSDIGTHERILGFNPKELKARYAEERAKRVRPEGKAQYRPVFVDRPDMLADPFDRAPLVRARVNEEVDALVVGTGMSGLMTAGALIKNGVQNIRLLDSAGDFGGTWYWNRYPGAQCDTESYIYMPWLEETGYIPTEKYARGPELFAYFKRLGGHFGLYEKTFFKTRAQSFTWDEQQQRWIVTTDYGDEIRARFVSLSTGSLAQPKLPDIPGVASFTGHMFLTARWDYDYTGGSPSDPQLTGLQDKRVAIVGTGCTGIQAVPAVAAWAKELLVFQRTPSMINQRDNCRTDETWAGSLKSGWQAERVRNFEMCVVDRASIETDLVNDGWTELARRLSDFSDLQKLVDSGMAEPADLPQLADFIAMEGNRTRVQETITNSATAENMKPFYNVHCKRPTFHDEFLPTFNRANVKLIDTSGKGVERITGNGIVSNGEEHAVDCIIFATGFEALSMFFRTGQFTVTGVGGRSLEKKWSGPFRSLHGVFTHDFPNMAFVGQIRDGGGSFNATYPFSLQAVHVGEVYGQLLRDGVTRFEVTREAEENWAHIIKEKQPPLGEFLAECTPGYLNNEGNIDEPALRTALYAGPPLEYEQILERWRHGDMRNDAKISGVPTA